MNVFLSASAQSQLAQLQAANAVPLNRISSKMTTVKNQQAALSSVQTEFSKAKDALKKLEGDGTTPPTADAVKAFVSEFNNLENLLASKTGKGGSLQMTSQIRSARFDLRSPFSNYSVLSSAKAAGLDTSKDGLVTTAAAPTAALTPDAVAALEAAFAKVSTELTNASTQMQSKLDDLSKQQTRVQERVDAANTRTTNNFMKMYQIMQQMNSGTGTSGVTSLFSGLA